MNLVEALSNTGMGTLSKRLAAIPTLEVDGDDVTAACLVEASFTPGQGGSAKCIAVTPSHFIEITWHESNDGVGTSSVRRFSRADIREMAFSSSNVPDRFHKLRWTGMELTIVTTEKLSYRPLIEDSAAITVYDEPQESYEAFKRVAGALARPVNV